MVPACSRVDISSIEAVVKLYIHVVNEQLAVSYNGCSV
jgi:hypothetical protein